MDEKHVLSFYDTESKKKKSYITSREFHPSTPNSARATGPSPAATKLNVVVEAIEALEKHQSEFEASLRKSLWYLQLKIDVQNETIQEQGTNQVSGGGSAA